PTENEFYFDKDNNPWTITSSGLKTLIKKQWQTVKVPGYEEKDVKFTGSTIGTDLYGNVYAIAYIAKKPHLIRASANNLMADFVQLPYRGVYALGTNTARKDTYHPPAVLNYRRNSDVQPIGK